MSAATTQTLVPTDPSVRRRQRITEGTDEPILIGGSDEGKRARLVRELARTMPHTAIEEVSEAWQLLERAPRCRIVMLADGFELDPPGSLARLLSRRHPSLPVVAFEDPDPAAVRHGPVSCEDPTPSPATLSLARPR